MAELTPRAKALSALLESRLGLMPPDVRKAVTLAGIAKAFVFEGDITPVGISAEGLVNASNWDALRALLRS